MGAKPGKQSAPPTQEEVDRLFEGTYRFSGCIDIIKLKKDLGIDASSFTIYQRNLSQKTSAKQLESMRTYKEFKKVARNISVPD